MAKEEAIEVMVKVLDGLCLTRGFGSCWRTLKGQMRRNFIPSFPSDRVLVELSPYDLNRGRITYRYK